MRNIFIEKSCRKCAPKAGPRPLFERKGKNYKNINISRTERAF